MSSAFRMFKNCSSVKLTHPPLRAEIGNKRTEKEKTRKALVLWYKFGAHAGGLCNSLFCRIIVLVIRTPGDTNGGWICNRSTKLAIIINYRRFPLRGHWLVLDFDGNIVKSDNIVSTIIPTSPNFFIHNVCDRKDFWGTINLFLKRYYINIFLSFEIKKIFNIWCMGIKFIFLLFLKVENWSSKDPFYFHQCKITLVFCVPL